MLAFLALALQNPNPPDVLLPEGWRVTYAVARNEGKLVSPSGHEIKFVAYGSAGDLAAELRGADPKAVFTHALLEGRRVDVAISRDDRLVVSYPSAAPATHSSFASFDYSSKVTTPRQAAIDLLILLTRIEAYKGEGYGGRRASPPPTAISPSFLVYWTGVPFGWMSRPLGSDYVPNKDGKGPAGRIMGRDKPTIELFLPEAPPKLPAKYAWEESRIIFGREFHIAEGEHRGLVAWVSKGTNAGPIFTINETSPRAAVVLILTRISQTPDR